MRTRGPRRRGNQPPPSTSRLVPSVDELADEVCDGAGGDAAARIRAAIHIGRELTTVGYALVERFVFETRTDGPSSSRDGKPAGTSARAAQERRAGGSASAGAWSAEFADRFAGP
jgi:hypothetical protein